jgi:hypothetical protein
VRTLKVTDEPEERGVVGGERGTALDVAREVLEDVHDGAAVGRGAGLLRSARLVHGGGKASAPSSERLAMDRLHTLN